VLCEPGKENGSTAELVINASLNSSKKGLGNEEPLEGQFVHFDLGHSRGTFGPFFPASSDQYHIHVYALFKYSVVGTL
jgi:hypothetical protein